MNVRFGRLPDPGRAPAAAAPSGSLKRAAPSGAGMSVQTDKLEELGRELGDAIAETPEYQAFEEAKAAVEADDEVQAQISEFRELRDQYMQARQVGQASEESLRKVQEAQEELHAMPKMAEYVDAQEELQDRLEAVNEAISAPLDVDFGGEAGGCCHD